MISNHLTVRAMEANQRYLAFTDRLRGFYHSSLTAHDFGSPAFLNRISQEAETASLWFLREEWQHIQSFTQEIAEIARRATLSEIESIDARELTDEALEHVSASCDYLYSEIVAQVSRDTTTLKRTLQRVNLEVSIASRSRGSSRRSALMEYMIGNKADIDFAFHDRASRKWKSSAFVRSVWRHTLLSIYNEIVLFTLAEHGLRTAEIHSDNDDANHRGMIIALSSNGELPTYSEIREQIFHPNANSYLKKTETADV
jgi:hypothetical protein